MSEVYFDTVLNERMVPIKYGVTRDILSFLRNNKDNSKFKVLMGEAGRVVNADKYVEWQGIPLSNFAREVKKNNRLIIEKFVKQAMLPGDPEEKLVYTVDRIMNVFYADGPH